MKLDRVTITGADDSVTPQQLLDLHKEFHFVEFGILLSQSSVGTPRFPSYRWLLDLYDATDPEENSRLPHFSCHICGSWARQFVAGKWSLPWQYDWIPAIFDRAQINFNAKPGDDADELSKSMLRWLEFGGNVSEFIIQHNKSNAAFFEAIRDDSGDVPIVPLFDRSGGRGEIPLAWPKAEYVDVTPGDGHGVQTLIYHGYAGGLGPDTLEAELPKIAEAAGDARIWIDMESGIRSDNDRQFDLAKVRRCLEICRPSCEVKAAETTERKFATVKSLGPVARRTKCL